MRQCEHVEKRASKRVTPTVRCTEDGTQFVSYPGGVTKHLCHYHARFAKVSEPQGTAFKPHREMVMGLPMPGFEAMKALAREIGA